MIPKLRKKAGSKLIEGFFRGLSAAGKLHPKADPAKHGVEVIRDVAYASTGMAEHRLDVYRPIDTSSPRPVCLYVHGGGFRILSKDSHWIMGLIFARRGYVVFNVNYRLAPTHPYPAAVEDVFKAYDWVIDNAERWGGDLDNLIFAGESAGGNLITGLTIALCYERPEPFAKRVFAKGVLPKAVVPACPILEVSNPGRFSDRQRVPQFVDDRIREVSDAYLPPSIPDADRDLADVIRVFERGDRSARDLPPMFVPCGTGDLLWDDAQRIAAAYPGECTAKPYAREPHAFHALVFRKPARQCWSDTFDFLDRYVSPIGQETPVPPNPQ